MSVNVPKKDNWNPQQKKKKQQQQNKATISAHPEEQYRWRNKVLHAQYPDGRDDKDMFKI